MKNKNIQFYFNTFAVFNNKLNLYFYRPKTELEINLSDQNLEQKIIKQYTKTKEIVYE